MRVVALIEDPAVIRRILVTCRTGTPLKYLGCGKELV
jgi:hypothetical protein